MVLNPGKCCYKSFGTNSDKSDLFLEDSTKIPSAELQEREISIAYNDYNSSFSELLGISRSYQKYNTH